MIILKTSSGSIANIQTIRLFKEEKCMIININDYLLGVRISIKPKRQYFSN